MFVDNFYDSKMIQTDPDQATVKCAEFNIERCPMQKLYIYIDKHLQETKWLPVTLLRLCDGLETLLTG